MIFNLRARLLGLLFFSYPRLDTAVLLRNVICHHLSHVSGAVKWITGDSPPRCHQPHPAPHVRVAGAFEGHQYFHCLLPL
jgi:hypothetical protein